MAKQFSTSRHNAAITHKKVRNTSLLCVYYSLLHEELLCHIQRSLCCAKER